MRGRYAVFSALCVAAGVATLGLMLVGAPWWMSLATLIPTAGAAEGIRRFHPDDSSDG